MNFNEKKNFINSITTTDGNFRELVTSPPINYRWLKFPIDSKDDLIIAKRLIPIKQDIDLSGKQPIFSIKICNINTLKPERTIGYSLSIDYPCISFLYAPSVKHIQNMIIQNHIKIFDKHTMMRIFVDNNFRLVHNDSQDRMRTVAILFGAYEYFYQMETTDIIEKKIRLLEYMRKYREGLIVRVSPDLNEAIRTLKQQYGLDMDMGDWANML
jgi:hypothetical protein